MAAFLCKLVLVTLVFGVIEAGFDVGNAAAPAEHGGSHEIHSHPGTDSASPDNPDTGSQNDGGGVIGHYCHCSTHAAALNFIDDAVFQGLGSIRSAFLTNPYNSLFFPPPVPPPTA